MRGEGRGGDDLLVVALRSDARLPMLLAELIETHLIVSMQSRHAPIDKKIATVRNTSSHVTMCIVVARVVSVCAGDRFETGRTRT
jgi:hypothetical protein